jgi:16S rRNA (uracil1498-N3)-methyltransferase
MEFYFSDTVAVNGVLTISGAEARHISRVMRHRPGDRVAVTDGRGTEYEVELATIRPAEVTARVLSQRTRPREPRVRLTLAQSVLKGDRLTQVCEQATELGVAEFIPLRTRRTVGRLGPARAERLRTVARAALKSSTGTLLPEFRPETDLDGLVRLSGGYGQALVAYEDEKQTGLASVLAPGADSVLLIIGPEGGFESFEIETLAGAGVSAFSLGPRRLRAETAATAAVSAVFASLGDLGGCRGPQLP